MTGGQIGEEISRARLFSPEFRVASVQLVLFIGRLKFPDKKEQGFLCFCVFVLILMNVNLFSPQNLSNPTKHGNFSH